VSMEYRWGGRLCLTFNGVQVFGEVADGVYSANVCNGLGASKGTLIGMLAAEHATGIESQYITQYLEASKPRWVPPDPFATIGAGVYLRWKERRAGLEK
jgi:glycine/D-amino acid oxidase-like deaminating enzyme